MTAASAGGSRVRQPISPSALDVQALWAKYEDIAMHFNDLLMRLRSQSLAGIAAVSTLVGLFTKEGVLNVHIGWLVAMAIFIALALFWVAIWCLDFFYYNRLLMGAVAALTEIEANTAGGTVTEINMSRTIEAEFARSPNFRSFGGVMAFYVIVLGVILAGVLFAACQYSHTRP